MGFRCDSCRKSLFLHPVFLLSVCLSCCAVDHNDKAKSLPTFHAVDTLGNPVNSSIFRGRVTFISYVNPALARDLDLFISIDKEYGAYINIVAIASKWTNVKGWQEHTNWLLIPDRDARLAKLFNVTHPGVNYLFDTEGILINASINQRGYDEGPKAALNYAIFKKAFDIRMIYPARGLNISTFPWLGQLASLRKTNPSPPYMMFGMFSSICDGCSSGFTLNMQKKIHLELGDVISMYIILPSSYSPQDVSSLYSQMNLSIPCLLADASLMTRWDYLDDSFRPSDINEIVFLTDRFGNIIIDFDKKTMNPQESFYLNCVSLITGGAR